MLVFPSIVKSENLMPVRKIITPPTDIIVIDEPGISQGYYLDRLAGTWGISRQHGETDIALRSRATTSIRELIYNQRIEGELNG